MTLWCFGRFLNLISLLILNDFLAHGLIRILMLIRIYKLIKFYVVLKWHLLGIIKRAWRLLKIEKWTKLLRSILRWGRLLFATRINLKSSISWTFSSFSHSRLYLLLLKIIDLFIYSLLILLLLTYGISLLFLLLLLA